MGAGHLCDRGPQISAPADSAVPTTSLGPPMGDAWLSPGRASAGRRIWTACASTLLTLQLLLKRNHSPHPTGPCTVQSRGPIPRFRVLLSSTPQSQANRRMSHACALDTGAHTRQVHGLTAESYRCTVCSHVCTQIYTYMAAHTTHTCTSPCHTRHLNQ